MEKILEMGMRQIKEVGVGMVSFLAAFVMISVILDVIYFAIGVIE